MKFIALASDYLSGDGFEMLAACPACDQDTTHTCNRYRDQTGRDGTIGANVPLNVGTGRDNPL
jgi:hypothetical protein